MFRHIFFPLYNYIAYTVPMYIASISYRKTVAVALLTHWRYSAQSCIDMISTIHKPKRGSSAARSRHFAYTLKPMSCHGANFVVTGDAGVCRYINLPWRQSWQNKNSMPAVWALVASKVVIMTNSGATSYDKVGIIRTLGFQFGWRFVVPVVYCISTYF